MKVKVTLDNKWYHFKRLKGNFIKGEYIHGAIKKQSDKRCITFSGRVKRINDEWIFEPNPNGKNFPRFESAFTPKVKESKLKLLTDDQVDSVFRLFKSGKRKRVPLPIKLSSGRVTNIWITKFVSDTLLRGQCNFYLPMVARQFTISGFVVKDSCGDLRFTPDRESKHFNRFQKYLESR